MICLVLFSMEKNKKLKKKNKKGSAEKNVLPHISHNRSTLEYNQY